MNEKTLYKLEFHKVLELVKMQAATEGGKNLISKMLPSSDLDIVKKLQEETAEAIKMSIKQGKLPLAKLHEMKPILKRVEMGAILGSGELLAVRDTMRMTRQVRNYYQDAIATGQTYEVLSEQFETLTSYAILEREISRCILAVDQFADDATPELFQIRRQIKNLSAKIKEALQNIIHSSHYQDMIQDPVITMRRERYCVPVKVEYKGQFKGIVHDQSATGATVFIEPMAVVELGNEIKSLESKEQEEIEKLLIDLTNQIAPITLEMNINYEYLVKLDAIFARSEFSLKYDCRQPRLNNKGYINLKKARHPLLNKETVVPIDVYVGKKFTSLLITGPNTGGKTVTLKTIGLFTLMAAIGLQLPAAEESEIAVFEGIYADLGDEQSIEQSLSTFSSHMTNIVEILNDMSLNSLVLLDEVGSGTDPIEGAALAMSILEHLRKQQIRTVATTHYSELKLYALSTDGVENASAEFNVETLSPTYRLLIGVPGKSNAFAISTKLGLPKHLIDDAKEFLQKENVKMEDILVDLEQSKRMAEIESERAKAYRAEAERLKEEIQNERKKIDKAKKKILERAETKVKELLKAAELEADQTLKEVRAVARDAKVMIDERSLQNAKQKMTSTVEGQKKRISKITGSHKNAPKKLTSVQVGEEVMVASLMQKGIVTKAVDNNGKVEVRMGIMPMKVNLSDLMRVEENEIKEAPKKKVHGKSSASGVSYGIGKAATISTEVDVRGMMVDEANPIVDKYLDDAYLSGLKQVTIIHGKGTGALRAGITQMLRRHPHVAAHRPGTFGEGEMGVTVVTIK
ncbi:endonuclease MutS2 [Cellulosilyticum ruminicola]|uniref:endonuclease MutS2 n=1 Tax=Cellulosilyticum ruminicola TaxID=425254 RepID=UPI0006D164B1|nr:endonuclease MutS2 [Cellulosilyticum ruminicola]